MLEEPSTTGLLPEDEIEATTLTTLDDTDFESSHELERVGIAKHPQATNSARVTDGINSSRLPLSLKSCLRGGPLQILC